MDFLIPRKPKITVIQQPVPTREKVAEQPETEARRRSLLRRRRTILTSPGEPFAPTVLRPTLGVR